jgi:hypothetical protein
MSTLHKITPNHLSNLFDTDGKKLNGAPFTIKSMKTGKDYTFKISQVPFKEKSFIHIKVEKGYLNFGYVGYFSKDGNIVRRNKEKNTLETITTPAATAASWWHPPAGLPAGPARHRALHSSRHGYVCAPRRQRPPAGA